MTTALMQQPLIVPIDNDHSRMMVYAQSTECKRHIELADSEIVAGKGIVADPAYFASLKSRRAKEKSATE